MRVKNFPIIILKKAITRFFQNIKKRTSDYGFHALVSSKLKRFFFQFIRLFIVHKNMYQYRLASKLHAPPKKETIIRLFLLLKLFIGGRPH